MKGTNIKSLVDGCFMQHVADNVDHNLRTLNRLNTFHGMGIIAAITPAKVSRERVPRLSVSSDEIVRIGNLERVTFSKQGKVLQQTKFKALSEIKVADPTKILGDLWKCAWLLKSRGLYGMVICKWCTKVTIQGSHLSFLCP